MENIIAMALALILDRIFGDPINLPHPVVYIGRSISFLDKALRKDENTDSLKLIKGLILVLIMISGTLLTGYIIESIPISILRLTLKIIVFFFSLACRTLGDEALRVKEELEVSLVRGRKWVSRIVGRDTENLDEEGVIKATIETVAENTSDGIIAPMLYGLIFGTMGALTYKAVNTMDSMIAYRNEKYLYFGRAAARLDDAANLIPSRITGILAVLLSPLMGGRIDDSMKVFIKDRYLHESPNSCQCESAFAGALGIKLNGPAYYEGELLNKEYINKEGRRVLITDIERSAVLINYVCYSFFILYAASFSVMHFIYK